MFWLVLRVTKHQMVATEIVMAVAVAVPTPHLASQVPNATSVLLAGSLGAEEMQRWRRR